MLERNLFWEIDNYCLSINEDVHYLLMEIETLQCEIECA